VRLLPSLSALLFTAACGPSPSTSPPPSTGAEPSPTSGADMRCPAPNDPCMNADTHAQCMKVAASCEGEILQLESCPLQFACADAPQSAEPPGGDDDPCAGKACGDRCSVCPPGDTDCVETAVVKVCDAAGACRGSVPRCE